MNNRNIKILFLIDELQTDGGTEKQIIWLAESLSRTIYEPVIGVLHKTDYQSKLMLRTPIVSFDNSRFFYNNNFIRVWKLWRYLNKGKVDILQTHFIDSALYGSLAARICWPRPFVITTRRNLYHWVDERPLYLRLLRHSIRWTDRILVNSQTVFEGCQRIEKIPVKKITLIENAVELRKFIGINPDQAKEKIGLVNEFPVIGVVSNFRRLKGLTSFLEAAAKIYQRVPSARFIIIGKGEEEFELKALARDLGIQERVRFLEYYSDIPTVIAALDIAVQPSLSESFSNVLLEYMASGKPIVATRVGDAARIIEDGREGFLIPPDNPEKLSQAILRLSEDGERAAEMGRLARDKVEKNWSSEKILETYHRFYREIVTEKK